MLALGRGDAALAGLLIGALNLPHALAGPFVGRQADRSSVPRVTYAAAMLTFGGALAGIAATLGRGPVLVPVMLALLAGTAGPLLTGGLSGLLVGIVPADRLHRALSVDSVTYNLAGVGAPAAVAAVSAVVSPLAATLVLAAVVVAGAVMLPTLPVCPTVRTGERDRLTGALGEVARAVWSRPRLRAVTVATTLGHLGEGGLTLAAALLAGQLGRSHAAGGALMSGYALGALAGSLAMHWPAARRVNPVAVVLGSLPAIGVLLTVAALVPAFPVALVCIAAAGFFDGPQLTATLAVRGAQAPAELRTAVFTATASLKITAGAAGAALAGSLAGMGGQGLVLLVAATQPVAALVGWLASGTGQRTVPPSVSRARRDRVAGGSASTSAPTAAGRRTGWPRSGR